MKRLIRKTLPGVVLGAGLAVTGCDSGGNESEGQDSVNGNTRIIDSESSNHGLELVLKDDRTDELGVARFVDSTTGEDVLINVVGSGGTEISGVDVKFISEPKKENSLL